MKKRVNKKYAVILFILAAVIVFCFITDKSGRTGIRKTDTGDASKEAFSENASVRGTDDAVILDKGVSEEPYISPLDQTTIAYKDGFYYYRSAVHYNYLYRCDESGTNQECIAEQVPWELYAVGEWIYFTNRSQDFRLCRIKTDGSGLEVVCDEEIIRFFPIGNVFYCLVREKSGADRVFSCTEDGEMQMLYEGDCRWISTDGKSLYLELFMENPKRFRTIVTDVDGNIKKEYEGYSGWVIPTEEYLYYSSQKYEKENKRYRLEIVRINQETGEENRYEVPCVSEEWEEFYYTVKDGKLYILCYTNHGRPLKYGIFQCKADTELHVERYAKGEIAGEYTLHDKVEKIHFLNGNCFFKMYVDDGKGSLWHVWDCSNEKPDIFEEMQDAVLVDTSWDGDFFYVGYRNGYLEQDITYEEELEGDRGIGMDTQIILPKISDAVLGAETINQKIKEDAEQFYAEQLEFYNTVEEWEERTICSFKCGFAYADDSYVSIIYRKILGTTSGYFSQDYVARIYSSKTGEELQITDLFGTDWEKVVEHMTFLIRKTERSYSLFDENTFSFENDYRRRYYCLNDFGIDVLFVEDMRTFKEYHFVISYEELKDFLKENLESWNHKCSERKQQQKQNTEENLQITEESNSEKWITEECQKIIHDKEEAFGFDFTLAASEFENKIQGVWQVKEFVGWDDSSRYQWDGFYGDIVIFCEKAWIEDGSPWYQPVYACYTAKVNELEDPLRITWSDNRYKGKKAVLTMGVCTERNKKFSERRDCETILFLLIDDVIVMERNGSYWELEKVGDIEMSDALSNVKPN